MLNDKQVAYFLLALENLDKEIGEWTDEAIIDHLKSNIKLARGYMQKVIDENDNINAKGITQGEQVYATIRPGTRYEDQCNGQPFPVRFELSEDGYHWKGGRGGQYGHSDLELYQKDKNGDLQLIPTFHFDEPKQVIEFTLESYKTRANDGDLNPEHFLPYSQQLITTLQEIETKAQETYPDEENSYV